MQVLTVENVPSSYGPELDVWFRVTCDHPLTTDRRDFTAAAARLSRALTGSSYKVAIDGRLGVIASSQLWVVPSCETDEPLTVEMLNRLLEELVTPHVRVQQSSELPGLLMFHRDQPITEVEFKRICGIDGVADMQYVITDTSMVANPSVAIGLFHGLYDPHCLLAVLAEPRAAIAALRHRIEKMLVE